MKTSALKSNGTGLAYRGGMVFLRAADGALSFESAPFTAGRMTADGIRYHVTDHLGSVRAVLNGSNGEIIEAGDYAAYGDRTDRTSTVCEIWDQRPSLSTLPARDHFSGKEDQSVDFTVPYTDFGARHYAPSLRRWLTPDPLSEKYYSISPYAYCAGNPVNLTDPDGRDGMVTGSGTEEDPFVITVVYYYQKDMDAQYVEGLQAAIDDYNSSTIKKNGKYIVFNLSSRASDDPQLDRQLNTGFLA